MPQEDDVKPSRERVVYSERIEEWELGRSLVQMMEEE